jgi:hypothetical protein
MTDPTPEYRAYLERRYVDIKQIMEAMFSYFDPEVIEDNYLYVTLECEFNFLAAILDLEDFEAFLNRLVALDGDKPPDDADDI